MTRRGGFLLDGSCAFERSAVASSERLAERLVAWLRMGRRDFPWRHGRDPYGVWISEVMLQQTQAATVAPYFLRWMAVFPDVQTLAAASRDDVLKAWEGLGYYARARHLHLAAQKIVAEHGGLIPERRDALLALPGVGRYTAGAILSLAFDQAEPVLDGNVRRVLCRIYNIAEDPRTPEIEQQLWTLAESLVGAAPNGAAGDLNEALMELGAVVCTPRQPACPACPVRECCEARELGVQELRPVKRSRAPTPLYRAWVALIRDEAGRYLTVHRRDQGLLGGLWGFPVVIMSLDQLPQPRFEAGLIEDLGIEVTPVRREAGLRHAYTHFRLLLEAWTCEIRSGEPQPFGYVAVRWASPEEIDGLALAATDRKILSALPSNPIRS